MTSGQINIAANKSCHGTGGEIFVGHISQHNNLVCVEMAGKTRVTADKHFILWIFTTLVIQALEVIIKQT